MWTFPRVAGAIAGVGEGVAKGRVAHNPGVTPFSKPALFPIPILSAASKSSSMSALAMINGRDLNANREINPKHVDIRPIMRQSIGRQSTGEKACQKASQMFCRERWI